MNTKTHTTPWIVKLLFFPIFLILGWQDQL